MRWRTWRERLSNNGDRFQKNVIGLCVARLTYNHRWSVEKKKLKSLVFEGLFCLQSVYIRSRAVFECFSHGLSLVRRIVKGIRQMTSENILARLRSGDSWQENLSGSCLRTWHGGNTKYIYIFFPSPIQYRTWLDVFLFSKRDFSQLVKNDRNSWFIFFIFYFIFIFFRK